MDGNGSILTELLFRLVNLSDEINETFAGFWNALVRPFGELELSYGARLAVLSKDKVQSNRNDKILHESEYSAIINLNYYLFHCYSYSV